MKISVIIPVYNVQHYLVDCVQSVLNQSLSDFEILLIDDGSTDQSGKIADDLKRKDSRICVYHKENGGLSDARNYGIDRARGDYYTFIDSDDYVAPNYLEILYDLIIQYKADVSCLQIVETSSREMQNSNKKGKSGFCTGIDAIKYSFLRYHFGISACGKLFYSKLFHGILFPKGELYEDYLTIPYVFEKAKTVAYSETGLYYYFQRPGSITNTRITENHMRYFQNAEHVIEHFDQYGSEMHDASVARVVGESINRFAEILLFCPDYSEKIEHVKSAMSEYWGEVSNNPFIPKTTRGQVAFLQKSTRLYYILFKPYKRIKSVLKGKRL